MSSNRSMLVALVNQVLDALAPKLKARYCEPQGCGTPERVLALRAKGMSFRAIAAETGVSVMTVQRILKDLKDSDFN